MASAEGLGRSRSLFGPGDRLQFPFQERPLEAGVLGVARQIVQNPPQEPGRPAACGRQPLKEPPGDRRGQWARREAHRIPQPGRKRFPDARDTVQRGRNVSAREADLNESEPGAFGQGIHRKFGPEVRFGSAPFAPMQPGQAQGCMQARQIGPLLESRLVVLDRGFPRLAQAQHVRPEAGGPHRIRLADHELPGQFAHRVHVVPPEAEPGGDLVVGPGEESLELGDRRGVVALGQIAGGQGPAGFLVARILPLAAFKVRNRLARGA